MHRDAPRRRTGQPIGGTHPKIAKPAVSFGGKFRIIDFSLSNCSNSGIDTVGVLTQYRPYLLHAYVGSGEAWDLDSRDGGVSILPPYETQTGGARYAGTADAITQNLDYIKANDPKYVLILSGDHLYRMDYRKMLKTHIENNADLTVSVMPVPWEEASRFGILTTDPEDGRITKFTEKPDKPDSNLASMGIYIFSADVLIEALEEDALDQRSSHDFGKDIIPKLLGEGKRLYSYEFHGFWKDVGTIASFHETSMDLLGNNPEFDLFDKHFPIMSNITTRPPHYIGRMVARTTARSPTAARSTAPLATRSFRLMSSSRSAPWSRTPCCCRVRTLRAARTSAALFWARTPRSKRA